VTFTQDQAARRLVPDGLMVYTEDMTDMMGPPAPMVLHTPMPLMPLTEMVAGMGEIIVDTRPSGETCCFYGWGEVMAEPGCKPHHLVLCDDNVTLKWMAATLAAMGIEAVVSDRDDWSVCPSIFPMLYHDTHQH
jgi:hypothetical protein